MEIYIERGEREIETERQREKEFNIGNIA